MERLKQEVVGVSAALRRPRGAEAAFSMAALLTMGGVAGFAARRSKPSLIAGVVLGSSFGASGYAIGTTRRSVIVATPRTRNSDDTLRMLAASDSRTVSQRGCVAALVLSTLTAGVMGKRALSSRRLVKTLEVASDGQVHAQYSSHFQPRLAAYANPRNVVWMPGG